MKFYRMSQDERTVSLGCKCIEISHVKQRRGMEETQRCIVFKYFPSIEQGKLVGICQVTVCNVLTVTPKQLQVKQHKLKFNMDTKHCMKNTVRVSSTNWRRQRTSYVTYTIFPSMNKRFFLLIT